jgi:nitrite reductase (NO-forming)
MKNKLHTLAAPFLALLFGTGGSLIGAEHAGTSPNTGQGSSVPKLTKTEAVTPTYLRDVLPILMGKCTSCHTDQSKFLDNWLDYRTAVSKRWEIKRRVWDSWKGAYFKQPMPTGNSPEFEAMTEAERTTIRDWVRSGAAYGVRPVYASVQSKAERIEHGKPLFTTICAACHQISGQGIPGRFPPLAGSDFLNSDKHRAIRVVVNGLQGEVAVNGQKFNNSMPKFPLSDQEIACALTYVYNSFGNSGKEVTPEEVNAVRAEKEDPFAARQSQSAKVSEEKSPFE